jgi:hypothetical protein
MDGGVDPIRLAGEKEESTSGRLGSLGKREKKNKLTLKKQNQSLIITAACRRHHR